MKITKRIYFLAIFMIGVSVFGFSKPSSIKISKVSILDSDFKVIKTINEKTELEEFTEHWQTKKDLPPSEAIPGKYKIDVQDENIQKNQSHRYLYNEKFGTLRILTKTMTPEFQIKNPDKFNQLLGIIK